MQNTGPEPGILSLIYFLVIPRFQCLRIVPICLVKKRRDFFVQVTLVVFYLQHRVSSLRPYYLGGLGLTVHSIRGDYGPFY
jgi:hypothetical protein